MYVYRDTCKYIYICMYIHTDTHKHTYRQTERQTDIYFPHTLWIEVAEILAGNVKEGKSPKSAGKWVLNENCETNVHTYVIKRESERDGERRERCTQKTKFVFVK